MLGLNNKGWGLRTMIILTVVILIALLVATYYVIALYSNIDENFSAHKHTDSNSSTTNSTNNTTPAQPADKVSFPQYENIMETSAIAYAKKYNIGQTDSFYYVSYETLVNEELLEDIKYLKDDTYCTGYAHIYYSDTEEYSAKSYLSCNNYKTEGYVE